MFNWFRKYEKPVEQAQVATPPVAQSSESKPIPPISLPTPQLKDHYRVGYDPESESTTLTLHSDYTSMTLTLAPEEVLRLIRLLGASLDDDLFDGSMSDDHDDHQDED
jgi:hypothetical protein